MGNLPVGTPYQKAHDLLDQPESGRMSCHWASSLAGKATCLPSLGTVSEPGAVWLTSVHRCEAAVYTPALNRFISKLSSAQSHYHTTCQAPYSSIEVWANTHSAHNITRHLACSFTLSLGRGHATRGAAFLSPAQAPWASLVPSLTQTHTTMGQECKLPICLGIADKLGAS